MLLWRLCTHQEVGEELVYANQGLWHSQSGSSLTRGGSVKMVGQGKRMESGGVLREQDESGGACQPRTLPQCGVRAYRSNSSSGGNRGPGVKKFVRIWETRERPSSPPPWSAWEIREARFSGAGGGAGRPLLVNTVPSGGALGKAGSGARRKTLALVPARSP